MGIAVGGRGVVAGKETCDTRDNNNRNNNNNNNNNNIGLKSVQLQCRISCPFATTFSLCLILFPLCAIRKKNFRRFYSFACRSPGLERLLTGLLWPARATTKISLAAPRHHLADPVGWEFLRGVGGNKRSTA